MSFAQAPTVASLKQRLLKWRQIVAACARWSNHDSYVGQRSTVLRQRTDIPNEMRGALHQHSEGHTTILHEEATEASVPREGEWRS